MALRRNGIRLFDEKAVRPCPGAESEELPGAVLA